MMGVCLVYDIPMKTRNKLSQSCGYTSITNLGAAFIEVNEIQIPRGQQGKPMQRVPDEGAHGASSDAPRVRHNVASGAECAVQPCRFADEFNQTAGVRVVIQRVVFIGHHNGFIFIRIGLRSQVIPSFASTRI